MHFLPNVLLTVVVIAAYSSGYPTKKQFQDIVKKILFEDEMFQDLLSERIKLNASNLTPSIKETLENINDLHPLAALQKLSNRTEYYSGQALAASIKIVSTAVKCLSFKRMAVHVALTRKMLVLQTDQNVNRKRLQVFTNLIPPNMDMLITVKDDGYKKLLDLFDKINQILSEKDEDIAKQENLDDLDKELTEINRTIESSCTQNDMAVYFKQLNIATQSDSEKYPEIISDKRISDAVTLETIVEWVIENEKGVMDFYDLLYFLRTMELKTWKSFLIHANVPKGKNYLKRNPYSYRDKIQNILSSRFQVDNVA